MYMITEEGRLGKKNYNRLMSLINSNADLARVYSDYLSPLNYDQLMISGGKARTKKALHRIFHDMANKYELPEMVYGMRTQEFLKNLDIAYFLQYAQMPDGPILPKDFGTFKEVH